MNPTDMHAEILLPDEHRSAPRSWGGEPESKRGFDSVWEATIYGTDAKGLVLELGFLRTYLPASMSGNQAVKAREAEMAKVEKALALAIQAVRGEKPKKMTQLAASLRDAALKNADLAGKFKQAKIVSHGEYVRVWQAPSEQSRRWAGSHLEKTKRELAGLAADAGSVVDELLESLDGTQRPVRTAAGRKNSLLEKAHREAEILAGRMPADEGTTGAWFGSKKASTSAPSLDFGKPAIRERLLDALSDTWRSAEEIAHAGFPAQAASNRSSTLQSVTDQLEHLVMIGRIDGRRDSSGRTLYRLSGRRLRDRETAGREFSELSERVQKEARRMGASMNGPEDDECLSGRDAFHGRTTGKSEPGSRTDDSFNRYMEALRKLSPPTRNAEARAEGNDIDF